MSRLRRGLLPTLLALGLTVAVAAPAHAELAEGPDADEVISARDSFPITAASRLSALEVLSPSGTPVPADGRTEEGQPTLVFDVVCSAPAQPECGRDVVAPNGRWTIEVRGDGAEVRPFFLRVGGQPVTEVASSLQDRTAAVTWRPGPEADVTGWEVSDDAGNVTTLTPEACVDATCRATITYAADATGTRTLSVRAARPCGVEGCGDVLGPPVAAEPVTLPPPASAPAGPSPSGSATPGPAPSGSAGPSASAGGGRADLGSFASGFGTFAPKLGLPKLPPLPDTVPPAVAAPLPDTFEETLGYEPPIVDEPIEPAGPPQAAGARDARLTSTDGGLLGEEAVRGLAGALVLALSGAHLRTWLAQPRREDVL